MQNTQTAPQALKRSLRTRHLSMIAIGGSIGTGLFLASGAAIAQAGPAGALLPYIVIGLMVYFIMTGLGELAAFMPVSGAFAVYGARFVDEGFGFALGWNYWFSWAVATIAAGEAHEPEKAIPRAMRKVFWRILLFYVFAILVISLIVPYTDPHLLQSDVDNVSMSPFTLVFRNAGLLSAAAIMNAVILTSVVSAGNSGLYASTRMLFNLAREGKAPAFFSRLTRNGVPLFALLATAMVPALCFLSSMFDNASVYMWLLNMTGMTGFIAWLGIAVSHYRFRRGYVQQGHDINELPYRSAFFPAGTIFAFLLCLAVTLGQNYKAFLQDNIDWYGVASTYIGIPIFLVLWTGYKMTTRSSWIRYDEMRFDKQE